MSKTKNLFINSSNVNINNILQSGGVGKKEENVDDYEDVNNIDDESEEDDNIEEPEEEEEEEEEEENIDSNKNDEIDDNNSVVSVNENNDDNDDKESMISDYETNKCYQKYASVDNNDEIDLDEYFIDDVTKINKNTRISKPILSKYERVRLLSVRAKQLAQGAKPLIKNTTGLSSRQIALLELKNKIIPLIIERPIPNVGIERWRLSELEILD